MDLQNEAIELQKVFHQDYKTYWEETEAIKTYLEKRFKALGLYDVVKRTLDRKIAAYELVKMWFEKEYNTGTDRDELNEMEREAADLNSQIKVLRFMLAEVDEH